MIKFTSLRFIQPVTLSNFTLVGYKMETTMIFLRICRLNGRMHKEQPCIVLYMLLHFRLVLILILHIELSSHYG